MSLDHKGRHEAYAKNRGSSISHRSFHFVIVCRMGQRPSHILITDDSVILSPPLVSRAQNDVEQHQRERGEKGAANSEQCDF